MSCNRIVISESELRAIIAESIDETLDEFGMDDVKKYGKKALKGIGKAAVGAGLGAGLLWGVGKGLDNEEARYNANRQAAINTERYYNNPENYDDDYYNNEVLTPEEQAYMGYDGLDEAIDRAFNAVKKRYMS